MTVKKQVKKTGGKRRKTGGSLYSTQAGRGILSAMLPQPFGTLAKMAGLGRPRRTIRGGAFRPDPKEYARALISTLSPLATRDIISALN